MRRLIAVTTAALVLVSACGGDDDDGPDAGENQSADPCQVVAEEDLTGLIGHDVRLLDAVVYDELDEVACNVQETEESVAITWSLRPVTGDLEEMARDEGVLFGGPTSRSIVLSGDTPALELTYGDDPEEIKVRLLTVAAERLVHVSLWNSAPGSGLLSAAQLARIGRHVADAYARAQVGGRA